MFPFIICTLHPLSLPRSLGYILFCFPCYLFSFLFSFRDFYGDIHRLRESSSDVATPRGGILFVTVVLSLAFPSGSFLGGHLSAHTAHLGCHLLSPWGPLMLFGVNLTSWPDHLSIFATCGSDPVSLSSNCVFCLFLCFYKGLWIAESSAAGGRSCWKEA